MVYENVELGVVLLDLKAYLEDVARRIAKVHEVSHHVGGSRIAEDVT
jgi:hypothetical protein